MRRNHVLALAALALLVAGGGCLSAITGGPTSAQRLNEAPAEPYAWDAESDVHVVVTKDANFRAVYDVSAEGFGESLNLSRTDALGTKRPLSIRALRYRYPNGTVVNGTAIEDQGGRIYTKKNELRIVPPADDGQLAFTSESSPKRFSLPTYVDGSYTVVLPENRRAGVPLFGRIVPAPAEKRVEDDRLHIHWEEVTADSILVRYYIQRDLRIFAGLAGVLTVVAVGGLLYYRRQIRALERRRKEHGLDVDVEDDRDDPPPGMR